MNAYFYYHIGRMRTINVIPNSPCRLFLCKSLNNGCIHWTQTCQKCFKRIRIWKQAFLSNWMILTVLESMLISFSHCQSNDTNRVTLSQQIYRFTSVFKYQSSGATSQWSFYQNQSFAIESPHDSLKPHAELRIFI